MRVTSVCRDGAQSCLNNMHVLVCLCVAEVLCQGEETQLCSGVLHLARLGRAVTQTIRKACSPVSKPVSSM